jgi:hypothetical protein
MQMALLGVPTTRKLAKEEENDVISPTRTSVAPSGRASAPQKNAARNKMATVILAIRATCAGVNSGSVS